MRGYKLLMKFDEVGPSLNQWYVGVHWAKRKKMADYWHNLVKTVVGDEGIEPIHCPVKMYYRVQIAIGKPLRDASNCITAAKVIEDGLVRAGILEDDTPEFVRLVSLSCERSPDRLYHTKVYWRKA